MKCQISPYSHVPNYRRRREQEQQALERNQKIVSQTSTKRI